MPMRLIAVVFMALIGLTACQSTGDDSSAPTQGGDSYR